MTRLRRRFIEELALRGYSSRTVNAYVAAVSELAQHHGRSPAELSDEEVRAWVVHLVRERRQSESTVNVKVSALKLFFRSVLGAEPPVLSVRPRLARRAPVVLNHAEVRQILGCLHGARPRVALTTAYACGLRVSEVLGLRPEHIDSERLTLTVELGKGKKGRVLPLPSWHLRLLRGYCWSERPGDWLFEGRRTRRPMDASTLQRAFRAAREEAGVRKRATVHTLRHSYATHLLDEGVPAKTVQELLGHRSLTTTMRYLHVTGHSWRRLRAALESLGEGLVPAL